MQIYAEVIFKKENFFHFERGRKAPENQRKFFDIFARSRNFNPLKAENWYSVSRVQILRAGGAVVLRYHKGSHIKALVKLYPELMLKKENFWVYKVGWKAPEKRRNFFDRFAISRNFNPLVAENWYSVTCDEIWRAGGMGLLYRYNGSHIKALVKLYPELILKKEYFWTSKVGWKVPEKRRIFFDRFAISRNFNPLVAENWYSVTCEEIQRAGGRELLLHYERSLFKALKKIYPELVLKKKKFLHFEIR